MIYVVYLGGGRTILANTTAIQVAQQMSVRDGKHSQFAVMGYFTWYKYLGRIDDQYVTEKEEPYSRGMFLFTYQTTQCHQSGDKNMDALNRRSVN